MHPFQAATPSVLISGTTAATTARTANLDCQSANHATIVITTSAEANTDSTNVVLSVLESNDTTASNFATFNSAHERTIDNTAAAVAVVHVPLVGRKRYLRVSLTPDTTTNGAVIVSAAALLHKDQTGATPATVSIG